eukprot:scaffold8138_cov80-Skeletonema_dohrnii-CCMP3373.AAC.1
MTAASITTASLYSLALVVSTTAFVPSHSSYLTHQIHSDASSHLTKLNATKKKKTPKKSSTKNKSGDGFGSSSPTATKPKQKRSGDTIQYPELEDQ